MRFLVNRIPLKMRKATNNTNYVAVEFVVCFCFGFQNWYLPHLSSQNVLPCSRVCLQFIPSFLLHNSHNFALRKHIRKRKQHDRGTFVNLNAIVTKIKLVTIKQLSQTITIINRGTLAAYNSHPLNYQVCNKTLVNPNQSDGHLTGRTREIWNWPGRAISSPSGGLV